jgi:hypothetical protein
LTPPITRRCSAWVIVGLLAVAAGGCGLGDYEARMAEAQQRLDYLDREDRELEKKPLEMPEEKLLKDPEEVFLRVPKGVSTSPDTSKLWNGVFFRYAGGKTIDALYVAWAAPKEKNFAAKVRGLSVFNNAGRKNFEYPTVPAPEREALKREGLELNATTYELPDRSYHLYLDKGQKVALVFEISHNNPGKAATDAMHLSLGTLALGGDAFKQRKEYRERTKAAPK